MNQNLRVFCALLQADIVKMRRKWLETLIDNFLFVFFVGFNFSFFLPKLGINSIVLTPLVGLVINSLITVCLARSLWDAADFQWSRYIDYCSILPFNRFWLIAKYIVSYTIDTLFGTLPMLLIGWLLFPSLFNYTGVNWYILLLFIVVGALFFSSFFLAAAMRFEFDWFQENIWTYFLLPMISLGCLYFPWSTLYGLWPSMGILSLGIPTTYLSEGLRFAIQGSRLYWAWSSTALIILIVLQTCLLYRFTQQRLDLP